jgi:hypothetical protein
VRDINDSSGTRYLLPIAAEFIPALGQLPSTAKVQVAVGAVDAAGNATIAPPIAASFAFALDAPPLVQLLEDTNYPNEGDQWAATSFRLADGTYANSFAAATLLTPIEGERLIKFVLYNAAATSVGFNPQLANDPTDAAHPNPVVENWEGWQDEALSTPFPDQDPFCTLCGVSSGCPVGTYPHFTFLTGGSATCAVPAVFAQPNQTFAPTKQTSAPLVVQAYRLAPDGTLGPATITPNGAYVVPAAAGGSMGMLALYVGRTSATVSRFDLAGAPGPGSLGWNPAIAHFVSLYADVSQGPAHTTTFDCPAGKPSTCFPNLATWVKRLDSAQSDVFASLSFVSNSFALNTLTPAGAASAPTTFRISRVVGH